jgi:hypothetical protein
MNENDYLEQEVFQLTRYMNMLAKEMGRIESAVTGI